MNEDKLVFEIDRATLDSILGTELSDKQWEVMTFELIDYIKQSVDEEVIRLYEDIDVIVEEYDN